MKIKQIIIIKETRENEHRVALTPREVSLLRSKSFKVYLESDAGVAAGFTNLEYIQAGAELFSLTPEGFPSNSLVLRVKRAIPIQEQLEKTLFHENTALIGFLDPLDPLKNGYDHIALWQTAKVNAFSLELLKFPPNDPRDPQAAMSRIAGRVALNEAIKHYHGNLPIRVTVIGTGPAGVNAALEAKKQGLPVQLFGRKEHYQTEFESAGLIYYVLPDKSNPVEFIQSHLSQETIVITAVRSIGEKSPILIDETSLEKLPPNAVIIDLATGEGGNVVGSKSDAIVKAKNNISIINVSGYPKTVPHEASQAYASCLFNLLVEIISPQGEILFDHELCKQSWITRDGLRNDKF